MSFLIMTAFVSFCVARIGRLEFSLLRASQNVRSLRIEKSYGNITDIIGKGSDWPIFSRDSTRAIDDSGGSVEVETKI